MKNALISFFTASLLGVASFATGHSFGAAEFVLVLFTTGLVAWTVEQYSREVRPLLTERPLRFPAELTAVARREANVRLAASFGSASGAITTTGDRDSSNSVRNARHPGRPSV